MFCATCGNKLLPEQKVCNQCGEFVGSIEEKIHYDAMQQSSPDNISITIEQTQQLVESMKVTSPIADFTNRLNTTDYLFRPDVHSPSNNEKKSIRISGYDSSSWKNLILAFIFVEIFIVVVEMVKLFVDRALLNGIEVSDVLAFLIVSACMAGIGLRATSIVGFFTRVKIKALMVHIVNILDLVLFTFLVCLYLFSDIVSKSTITFVVGMIIYIYKIAITIFDFIMISKNIEKFN